MTDPILDQPFELKRKHVNAIAGTVALFLTLLFAGIVIAVRLTRGERLVEGVELTLFLAVCGIELFIGAMPLEPLKQVLDVVLDHAPGFHKEGT